MRFVTKFALALVLPAFVPAEPYPPLATLAHEADAATAWQPCPAPQIVDGDTIRCGSERVRLLGVDAPELHGCPRYRVCAPGDGNASRLWLLQALNAGYVEYRTITRDRYGRAVAIVRAGNLNLSCWQLAQRQAVYVAKWDNGQLIARDCQHRL